MQKLSVQEEEVMQAIWKAGSGFVRDFMEEMNEAPPYTTVASTVKNLEKKKFLSSKKMANSYYYSPIITEDEYAKKHISGFVHDYFKDSYKELVTFFIKEKNLSEKELKDIIALIEKGKK